MALKSSDLIVSSVIAGANSAALAKNGTGRLELDAANTFTGATTIDAGNVQVGGTIGNVSLNGGTAERHRQRQNRQSGESRPLLEPSTPATTAPVPQES